MRCIHPTVFNKETGLYLSCGQCMACRINRRQEWLTKLMLEWHTWGRGVFVTLTYSPEFLPHSDVFNGGTLVKKDLQDFMKRLRFHCSSDIRFFACGEYGSKTHRAHYHLILFNLDPLIAEDMVSKSWKKGLFRVDDLSKDTGNRLKYTLKYTIKKMTAPNSFDDGRSPEFNLMSRKPALGYYSLDSFAKILRKRNLFPSRSINRFQKFLHGDVLNTWDGVFRKDGNYYRFDTHMMSKLARIAYSEFCDNLQKMDDNHVFLPKKFKIRKERLISQSFLDNIHFVGGDDHEKAVKKSEKAERSYRKNLSKESL